VWMARLTRPATAVPVRAKRERAIDGRHRLLVVRCSRRGRLTTEEWQNLKSGRGAGARACTRWRRSIRPSASGSIRMTHASSRSARGGSGSSPTTSCSSSPLPHVRRTEVPSCSRERPAPDLRRSFLGFTRTSIASTCESASLLRHTRAWSSRAPRLTTVGSSRGRGAGRS
jgi:hypothetical protein